MVGDRRIVMKKIIIFSLLMVSNILFADAPKWVSEPDKVCKKYQQAG